jgi:hypothetical protein
LVGHTTRSLVRTGTGAVARRLVRDMHPRKDGATYRTFHCRFHYPNNTGQPERGRSKSLGQRQ